MSSKKHTPSITLRLAALMDREKIESLPRNYELVYDVYSGSNPELAREFMALGDVKTQKALDEIGRKHIPHQHEEGVLAKANGVMQSQMSNFLQLIEDESSSLAEFEKIISEASRAMSSDKELDRAAIAKSIDQLSKATERQLRNNKTLGDTATAQNAAIAELKKEMEALEARKWTDPLTGLANRRCFNKTIMGVYQNPGKPAPCGLVLAEFDDFRNFNTSGEFPFSSNSLREIARLFSSVNTSRHFMAYLDKGRFAFMPNTGDPEKVVGFVDTLRTAVSAKRPRVTKKDATNAEIKLSFGIAMASSAGNPRELVEFTESALSDSVRAGGDKVTIHSTGEPAGNQKSWLIYSGS
jgi:diguanylate cyclase